MGWDLVEAVAVWKRGMFLRLFLALTLVPLVELWLLLRVGEQIGVLPTLFLVVVTGAVGAALARREGTRAIMGVGDAIARGELPAVVVLNGALVVVGAVLLVTPGVITDALGLATLLPRTRELMVHALNSWCQNQILTRTGGGFGSSVRVDGVVHEVECWGDES